MKFPRNARIFRGQLDAAPFASVFLLLVVFVLLRSMLYTPGIRIELPSAGNLPLSGVNGPTVSVAVTTNALYFENQLMSENDFSNRLSITAKNNRQPLTLIVQADRDVTEAKLVQLRVLADGAGVRGFLLATLPRPFDSGTPAPAQP